MDSHTKYLILLFVICANLATIECATTVGFYSKSCPSAETIVRSAVQSSMNSDVTIGAGLLRLHFHDCFVQGCDGSVLIDGSTAEKTSGANAGLRGFEVIADAKSKLEAACPGVVSCADILALAARDAVDLSGGPRWPVPTGRRDGRISSASDAANLPSPRDSIATLKQKFADKGLSTLDMVTLNGAHTIGQTECRFFNYRLYNFNSSGSSDPSMSSTALSNLQQSCPSGDFGSNKVALDSGSRDSFDNSFFRNAKLGNAVLESDQRMADDGSTSVYVKGFALVNPAFKLSFAKSMIKMSNIGVLTQESDGEIRKVCSSFN